MADPSSFASSQYFVIINTPAAAAAAASPSQFILAEDPSSSSVSQFTFMTGPSSSSSLIPSSPSAAASEQQEQDQEDVAEQRDWTSLHDDMLFLILDNVRNGLDYVSFRSVCTSWLSAAPLKKFPPMLLLSFQPETGRIPFYSPSDGEVHLFPYTGARGAALAGCTGSWLTLVERDGRMSMANPFTGDVVQLPSATDELVGHSNMPFSMSGLYRVSPNALGSFKLERVWKTFVEDVALSSDPYADGGCTIMLTLACSNRVAFYRIGADAAWTVLDTNLIGPVRAVRHCGGRFFIVDWNGDVVACEIPADGPPGNATVTPMVSLRTPYGFHDTKFLEHNGELFMVVSSSFSHLGRNLGNLLGRHGVYKSDLQGGAPRWSKVKDMGDSTIFLTVQCNSCYIGSNLDGCKRNSIYFSDHGPFEPYNGQTHDIKVLDFATGISSTVRTNYAGFRSMKLVSWMKPSLRRPRN